MKKHLERQSKDAYEVNQENAEWFPVFGKTKTIDEIIKEKRSNVMRTQLELWQVVKDNFDEYFIAGLCYLITDLYLDDIINSDELQLLKNELKSYDNTSDFFLGVSENPKPRLEFIDKIIKKHSENAITENK